MLRPKAHIKFQKNGTKSTRLGDIGAVCEKLKRSQNNQFRHISAPNRLGIALNNKQVLQADGRMYLPWVAGDVMTQLAGAFIATYISAE